MVSGRFRAEFEQIVERGIAQHNARTGRRGGVCNGRSFDQVFAESYANGVIGKARPSSCASPCWLRNRSG
jgi:hypothetical protein